jgi:glycosyltransferase involved in cell wall biosynthesis
MTRVLLAVSAGGYAMRRTVAETIAAAAATGRYALRALAPEREGVALRALGIPVEAWRPAGLFNVLRSVGALRRAVEREDPDVIAVFGWTAAAVILGALPERYASRAVVYLQDPIRKGEMPNPFIENRLPQLLGRAPMFAVAYEALQRGLVNAFAVPEDRIALEPPAVRPLTPPNLARAPGRPGPILGYVGSLDAERAWEVAIDALALTLAEQPRARLWFANTGRIVPLVRQHARTQRVLDAVTFYNDLPAAELFVGIDVLVAPRVRDGLPYAPLEAVASGIPFVAANVDGMASALAPYAGFLVPDDAAGFAEGIAGAWASIDALWEQAAAQRARACEAFDPDAIFTRTFARWDAAATGAGVS